MRHYKLLTHKSRCHTEILNKSGSIVIFSLFVVIYLGAVYMNRQQSRDIRYSP